MFTKKTSHTTQLDEQIDSVIADLTTFTSETDEYAASFDKLEKLYALRALEHGKDIDPDTLVKAAAHLAGIVLIVGYEQRHVLTSQAVKFLGKLL